MCLRHLLIFRHQFLHMLQMTDFFEPVCNCWRESAVHNPGVTMPAATGRKTLYMYRNSLASYGAGVSLGTYVITYQIYGHHTKSLYRSAFTPYGRVIDPWAGLHLLIGYCRVAPVSNYLQKTLNAIKGPVIKFSRGVRNLWTPGRDSAGFPLGCGQDLYTVILR